MQAIKRFHSYLFLAVAASHLMAQSPDTKHLPQIQRQEDRTQITLTASIGDAKMRLIEHHRDRVLDLRVSSQVSIDQHIPVLRAMLQELPELSEEPPAVETFFVGRLIHYPEFAKRLSEAAAKSDRWDASDVSQYPKQAAEVARSEKIFKEWQALFIEFDLEIHLSHMEKILVGTPSKSIPFGQWLLEQGVPQDQKLPFDALTFFSIQRIP